EKLQHLLSDEAWEKFVAAAELSRDEADALYADLHQLETLMAEEDKDMPSADQLHGESFMKEFPQVKQNLEEHIRKLYALADEVDKVHRDCTISQVAASSTGAVSGILTIVGLSLAPFTAGASLVLLAIGIGLGAAASVTGVTTGIVEYSKNKSAKAKASNLVSTGSDTEKVVVKVPLIVKNSSAFNLAKSNPVLAAEATSFMCTGTISAQSGRQVQRAFRGTALAKSKGASIFGAATTGFFLLMDVIQLVKESNHVLEGSKAQSAEELRQQAQELERRLEELTCIHE
uniref:Apolipoprotein L3 n=1 Tax=Myotis lucifugus TaxID=59463 RepID=G1QCW5_MYOLU